MTIEASIGEDVLDALRKRGHELTVTDPWTVGRLTAARRDADGLLRG
jgi:gamma-glutamyltranspeptidase/glutathione hydrolase